MAITKVSPNLLDLDAGITISVADNTDNLTLTTTDADASVGPNLRMYRNSGSAADNDLIGAIDFEGKNDAGSPEDVVYAQIFTQILDASDGTEDGYLSFKVMNAGTSRQRLLFDAGETVFNDESQDVDFRIESDGSTHMFQVDAANNKILMSANPAADTQSTPHDILTLATAYSSSGADGAAGLGPRIVFKIPDDEDNPSTGGGIAVVKESGDDSNSSAAMTFATSQNDETLDEAMRIDASGTLLIGKTSTAVDSSNGVHIKSDGTIFSNISSSTTGYQLRHNYNNRFFVTHLGVINAQTTSITGISDVRLKENIVDLETGLTEVLALKPRRFNWIEAEKVPTKNIAGFIAQEVETVLPDLIGSYDHDRLENAKSLRMGDMIPTLVKAIQELTTKLEAAEARITTLEG